MNVGIICSNNYNIEKDTASGTAAFNYELITNFTKYTSSDIVLTAFASGASSLPVRIESVDNQPSSSDPDIHEAGKHVMFELALISKAFSMQERFDLYHINIGEGDLALPFAPFVKKPILITLHHIWDRPFMKKYFSLFKDNKNIFFISISNSQRKLLPDLNYAATIYHGVNINSYIFNQKGGDHIMWAGRAIPEKGVDIVVNAAMQTKRPAKLFGITREEHSIWLQKSVINKINESQESSQISLTMDCARTKLIQHFETSKLFLLPVNHEESFGLVLIESMSCGTPIVAYARGSLPEIVKDGETGFLVNPSGDDIRGNWIIKKTGIEGLIEAVERIYSMPTREYEQMRVNCRKHVEANFTVKRMANEYEKIYKEVFKMSH